MSAPDSDGSVIAGIVALILGIAFVAGLAGIGWALLVGPCAVPALEAPVWCFGLIR